MVQSAESKVSEAQKKRFEERWEAIWGSLAVPGGGGGESQMRPGGDQQCNPDFFTFRLVLCAITGVQSFHL